MSDGRERAIALQTRGLRMSYGPREALRGVDLSVCEGEVFGLLGPNGGGKSTMFRILATLLAPTGGEASVHGRDVVRDPHGVRRLISVVFQAPSLDRKLTVAENLRHQGHLFGLGGHGLEESIARQLGRVALLDRRDDVVETLSGGLKRRAEIAKSLLHDPKVLLLDEPTTGLDPGVRREVWDQLLALRAERGMTVVVTTHLMDEAERCDRVAILHRGEICALGTPEELRRGVGGDVVLVKSGDPEGLRAAIAGDFGGEPRIVDGAVRIERADAPEFLAALLGRYRERIEGVSLGRPTLEDAFVHRTGQSFEAAEREVGA